MPLNYRTRGAAGTQLDVVSGTAIVGRLWKAVVSLWPKRMPDGLGPECLVQH
jgi:hypothetical protein